MRFDARAKSRLPWAENCGGAKMNSRQRLLSVLRGEIPNRVPVVAFIDGIFLSHFLGRAVDGLCADAIPFCRELGLDAMIRIYCQDADEWETGEWRLRTKSVREDGAVRRCKVIETPDGELQQITVVRETQPGLYQTHTEEHLVKTPRDLALMERYHVIRPPVDTAPLEAAMRSIGDNGIVVTYGGGAAHTGAALYLRGLHRLTLDAVDDPAFYERLLNWAIEYESGLLDTLERVKPDLCQIGGLMAQGNFVGPNFYRKHVLPYDRRYIQEMHRRGLRTVYHNCGYSRNLLESYKQLGTDAFETFPPPPVGDGDMALVKKILGDTVVLIGNIDQVHLLREATPQQVYDVTRETILEGMEGGKYILMTADEVFPDTPLENLQAMARAGLEHGWYEQQT